MKLNFETELLRQALMVIAGLWAFYRFILPLLTHYFTSFKENGRRNNNVDMDILVRRQESILRKGMIDKKSAQQNAKVHRSNRCLAKYQMIATEQNLPANISKKDIIRILALHDELQWGDGKILKEVASSLQKKIGADYSVSALSKKLKQVFELELPLVAEPIMNYNQVIAATYVLIFIEILDQQSKLRRGQTLDYLANRSMLMSQDIALGYEAWASDLMGKPKDQYLKKLATFTALNESQLSFDLTKLQKKALHTAIKESSDYIDWTKNQIQIFSELMGSIKPVQPINANASLSEACQILGVSPKISDENLKKIYKKQAKLRHPDTLSAKNIPAQFEEKAKENFVRIKTAYDIILKNRK